jgi:addiction module RelE/StbE family toxin
MRTLIWSKTFIRALKRWTQKRPELRSEIENTLRKIANDPFDPQLKTHKLKGKLSGTWACSINYDLRIIFDFIKNGDREEDDIFLIEIGTHDEVY